MSISQHAKRDFANGLSLGCGIGQVYAVQQFQDIQGIYFGGVLGFVAFLLGLMGMLGEKTKASKQIRVWIMTIAAGVLTGIALAYSIHSFVSHRVYPNDLFAGKQDALFYVNVIIPVAVSLLQMFLYINQEQAVKGGARDIDKVLGDPKFTVLRACMEETKSRLSREIYALRKKANLNLIIGIATTLSAIGLLWYFVVSWEEHVAAKNPEYYLILRVSTVVFVEIFSFFFLRLYRASLDAIKYFQNELTNVELRFVCIESAFLPDVPLALIDLLSDLVKTERNFVLRQGETTVGLKQAEVTKEGYGDFAKAALELMAKTGKR